jgi:hypothetical protein
MYLPISLGSVVMIILMLQLLGVARKTPYEVIT